MALQRSLGPLQLIFYGVGTIVGAGIYSVIGAAAGEAGHGLWLSFVLAAIAAGLTGLSYAELSAMLPRAGAEYQYLKQAFPAWRAIAVIAGTVIGLNAAATAATVSLAFSGYLSVFVELPAAVVAVGLLAACTALNIAGLRQSTWVTIAFVCIEVGGLLLLIGTGLAAGEPGEAIRLPQREHLDGVVAAAALAFFVYIGFEDIANLGDEAREPKRDLPRALLISIVLTTAIYLLVVWAALALVSPEQLAGSRSPLTLVAGTVKPWIGQTLAVAALFATASTALVTLISISRLLYGMARDGDLPSLLRRELPGRRTPWVAALVLFAAACALLPLGNVGDTARVSSLGILLVFTCVHAALIALRLRDPKRERPFRVPFAIGRVPVLPVIGGLYCIVLATNFPATAYLIVGGVVAAAAIVHWLMRRVSAK